LVCRLAIPLHRFDFVLHHAFAGVVAESEQELSIGVSLLGFGFCCKKPDSRCFILLCVGAWAKQTSGEEQRGEERFHGRNLPPLRSRIQCSPVAAYKLMLRRNVCFVPTSPRRAVRACRDSVLFLWAKQPAAPTGTATTSNGDSARTGTRRSGGTASRSTAGSTAAEKGTSGKTVAATRRLHLGGRPLERR